MQSYTPRQTTTPSVSSVTFPDGSRQVSARIFEDIHIRKKLKTEQKGEFMEDVEIHGPLHIHGALITDSGMIDTSTKQYVDIEMDKVFALLGWDNETSKWITSDTQNGVHFNLDYRVSTFTQNHYDKTETDARIQSSSTLAMQYYTGSSTDKISLAGISPPVISTPTSAIPAGNAFVIPQGLTSHDFYIQNSGFGTGKVLTSDAFGKATWQNPNTQITTAESISTSFGQTSVPSFYVKDSSSMQLNFNPNMAPQSTSIQKAGDYTLQMTGAVNAFTLTTGNNVNIIRPSGIRMSCDTNGTLELYGGWAYDQTYPSAWLIESGQYLGTYIQNTMRMDYQGIHMTHNHGQAIHLYGKVYLHALGLGSPSYRKNPQSTPSELIVDGSLSTTSLKVISGAAQGKVLTCMDSNGTVSWENTQATSNQTEFLADIVTFNGIECLGSTTSSHLTVGGESLKITPTSTFIAVFKHPPFQLNDVWLADGQMISSNQIVRNQKIYSQPKMIDYYDIQVGANFTNGIELTCPITIQDHWRYKNRLNQGNENKKTNMIYAIEQLKWFVYDLDENLVVENSIDSMSDTEMGSVFVQMERRTDAWYTTLNSIHADNGATKIYIQTMLIDKPKAVFFPPIQSGVKNYRISIEVVFSYRLQLGETIVNYIPNGGTNYYFPRMLIGGGTTTFTPIYPFTNQPTIQNSRSNFLELELNQCTPFDDNGAVVNQIDSLQSARYSCIWFLNGDRPRNSYRYIQYRTINHIKGPDFANPNPWGLPSIPAAGELIEYQYPFCKLNKERTHYSPDGPSQYMNTKSGYPVSSCITYDFSILQPVISIDINPSLLTSNSANNISLGDVNINKINVKNGIVSKGFIYCNGIGGRQGVALYSPTLMNNFSNKYKATPYNSVFNFYWNEEDQFEIWVDTTCVYVGQPNWSDYRLKGNVHELTLENDEEESNEDNSFIYRLAKVPIFIYDLDNPELKVKSQQHIGCFAHVLQSTFVELPHLVHGSKDAEENGSPKYQHVNYNELTMVLFKAIQELHHEDLSHDKRVDELGLRISKIRNVCVFLFLLVLLGIIFILK